MQCPCHQQEFSLRFVQYELFWVLSILFIAPMCKVLRDSKLQETCLASKDAMPFDLLKRKLLSRLETMGIRILKTYEEVILTTNSMMHSSGSFAIFTFNLLPRQVFVCIPCKNQLCFQNRKVVVHAI